MAIEVADKFVQGFVAYSDIPRNSVTFSPLREAPKKGTQYSLRGAMHFGDDAWWHLGLVIILTGGQRVLVELCFNEDNEGMLLRLGAKGDVKRVNLDDPIAIHLLFEEIITKVTQFYAVKPQEQSTSSRKIGFEHSGVSDAASE